MNPLTLLQNRRYDPEILPHLEKFVNEEVEKRTYNLDANLAVLQFYQFFPEKTNKQIIAKILVKALMALPFNDFNMSLHLIAERVLTEDPFKFLAVLSNFLETGRFSEFWAEAVKHKAFLDGFPGFDDAIRTFIIGVISSTYGSISKHQLAEDLSVSISELEGLLSARNLRITGETVVFKAADAAQAAAAPKRTFDAGSRSKELQKMLQAIH
eukprot:TRINITY_DN31599_c0_g1_i1.p2 TRINITY_DN31599_c0_g1~~TRINITY_DN31599_c0_g1_i1.p2  ORF type:complete len:230 (+),score=52.82 TRINITY_DN31599_c0_g1_i1:56-691(+)